MSLLMNRPIAMSVGGKTKLVHRPKGPVVISGMGATRWEAFCAPSPFIMA